MSVRGTITSRTMASENSRTEEIIRISSRSETSWSELASAGSELLYSSSLIRSTARAPIEIASFSSLASR